MPKVTYTSFRYHLEDKYFKEFNPYYKKLLNDRPELQIDININEKKFLHLLSNAIRIDKHYLVSNLLRQINRHVKTDIEIKIFLFQSEKFESYCTPRITHLGDEDHKELIVLVSQHFLNNLGEYERIPIIAHELAHGIFKHAHYPFKTVLKNKFNLPYNKELKIAMLKWSFCAEITADAFSLVASDFNPQIVCRSLIKHTTGLQDVHGDDLIKMAIAQYEDLASTVHQEEITTHPLMPLRIKIIDEICKSNLAKSFGKNIGESNYNKYIKEYNSIIDGLVDKIYPEIIDNEKAIDFELQLLMSIVVTLSDYKLHEIEIEQLRRLVAEQPDYAKQLNSIFSQVNNFNSEEEFQSMVDELINRSVKRAKQLEYEKQDLIALIRYLIFFSAIDGKIHINELTSINKFSRKFNYKKSELILILSSLSFT